MFSRPAAKQQLVAPTSAVPQLQARQGPSPWLSIGAVVAVLAGIVFCLLRFGQPALRIEYRYTGSYERPQYTYCRYYALDGWHEARRRFAVEPALSCPPFLLFPINFN